MSCLQVGIETVQNTSQFHKLKKMIFENIMTRFFIFFLIWFDCVLWHINHCRSFNAKSSLYIYIKYIGFGLVGFYGISTIVGYLILNPFYMYISNI